MTKNSIPEKFIITQKGSRRAGNWCPHNKSFPAAVSALKAVMGLEQRVYEENGWVNDNDYFFQMGVSAEGFCMCCGMENFLKAGLFDNEALADCLHSEGFAFRLIADAAIGIKDEEADCDTLKQKVIGHLLSDRPAILIYEKYTVLAVGFGEFGETVITPFFGMGKSFAKNHNKPKPRKNWTNKLHAAVFIDGITLPAGRREIVLRALRRGYEMLTETKAFGAEYGYGEAMWKKWIDRFEDDSKFTLLSHAFRYIDPEKFDLAERRAYTRGFFAQAESYLEKDCLQNARRAFDDIHNKMWDIHWMVKGENKGSLLLRGTRERVMQILKDCRELDREAAKNIKDVLSRFENTEEKI